MSQFLGNWENTTFNIYAKQGLNNILNAPSNMSQKPLNTKIN